MSTARDLRLYQPALPEGPCDDRARSDRVLLVEDNLELAHGWMQGLCDRGYAVWAAADGAHALEVLEEVLPDVVLLDLSLPRLDGWATLLEIRRRIGGVAVVALSPYGVGRVKLERAGFDGAIEKPAGVDTLVREIARLLGPLPPYGPRERGEPS